MTPRDIERLEAEAAEQRRRFSESWENLQDLVPGPTLARTRRPHLRPEEMPFLTGRLMDMCLLAVAAGCAIELFRRVRNSEREKQTRKPTPRLLEGDEKWKTPRREKPRRALPGKNRRALSKRAAVRPLLPDLTNDPRQIN